MTTATKLTGECRMNLGTEAAPINVIIGYTYTPAVRADAYCGHDAPDREGEPAETEVTEVLHAGANIMPLLSDYHIDLIDARAERVAERAYDRGEL